MSILEIVANISLVASVWLAARNSIHTWGIGIVACALFGVLFYQAKLYADVHLQIFYIVTSAWGWWYWRGRQTHQEAPIKRSTLKLVLLLTLCGFVIAAAYGLILKYYTAAFAPMIDSIVLVFSVIAQCLLMGRRIENWYAWILVDTIAVPLYGVRELYLTAFIYLLFWFNAWYGLYKWRKELAA